MSRQCISFQPWIEELLPEGFFRRHMFGGCAYYLDGKLILVIFESPGDRTYKNKTANYDLWDGCMFPVEREKQEEAKRLFPPLFSHLVLPKWLYLPQQTEGFEEVVTKILKVVLQRPEIFGVYPKPKTKKQSKRRSRLSLKSKTSAKKSRQRKNK